jgi:hypothetical protein
MGHDTLTAVYFRHVFFAERNFDHVTVKVPSQTAIDMRRYGLLLRKLSNGFLLLTESSREELLRQKEKLTLTFDLDIKDPLFYNYTDFGQVNITKSFLLFTNNQENSAGTLHAKTVVSATELYQLKPTDRFFIKPFGRIVLDLMPGLETGYEIRFASKSARWRYYLMSDNLTALSLPGIIDTTGKVQFGKPQQVDLPGKAGAYMFTSDIALELTLKNNYIFQLVDDAKVVISTLPMPDISRISSAVTNHSELFSEIFLY